MISTRRGRPPSEGLTNAQLGDPALNTKAAREYVGGISEMTRWRWERGKEAFPRPDFVVGGRNFWRLSTLDKWIAERIAGQAQTSQPPRRPEPHERPEA